MVIKNVSFFCLVLSQSDGTSLILSSGPLIEVEAMLPLGSFSVIAQVYDEAGAFSDYTIKQNFAVLIPDQGEYEDFYFDAKVADAKGNGDVNQVGLLLNADVSSCNELCHCTVGTHDK